MSGALAASPISISQAETVRRQGLLGIEMLARPDRVAIDLGVQVARQRDDDRVHVGPLEHLPDPLESLGPVPRGLLDDPLPPEAMLGLGVADGDDLSAG